MTEHKTNMNITKYKKLNMTECKTDINITKIDKCNKKLNSTSMTEHKTDMNITEKLSTTLTTKPQNSPQNG